MKHKKSKKDEIKLFKEHSNEWWNENGKFKILHKINPLRIDYILGEIKNNFSKIIVNTKDLAKIRILDLGCGGGLICENLAKLNGKVTGCDFVEENIQAAKLHAKKSKLNIKYITTDIDKLKLKNKYDVILCLEVFEHLDDWKLAFKRINKLLKLNGIIIISTINRNFFSSIFAINIAENILGWVPKGTHNYNKLIKPHEISEFAKKIQIEEKNITGLNYNPINKTWYLDKKLSLINYFYTGKKIN